MIDELTDEEAVIIRHFRGLDPETRVDAVRLYFYVLTESMKVDVGILRRFLAAKMN